MKEYLPIGTVVLLKSGTKRVMIYGRKQMQVGTTKEWDYIACLYPEGNIDNNHMYLFNEEQIDKVYFMGYQDQEEEEFTKKFLVSEEKELKFI